MEDLEKTSRWDEVTSLSDEDLSQVSGGVNPDWSEVIISDDFYCDKKNDTGYGKSCYYDQNYSNFTFPWRCCNSCGNNPKNCK